ncbi:MAG TPA: SRPBCC family protein [Actinomycetota bacterium]|nr:SRPBCC family protein [Actinomycetota bacterium]
MTAATELPSLVKEVRVAAPVERAWKVFTDGIDSWWPVATHSVAPDRVAEIVFEPGLGGRILERRRDGDECVWGEVDVYEPPHRVRFSWHPNEERPAATEVEVTFAAVAGGTLVRLEHRGWERLGAIEGAESRGDYDTGWDLVLARYVEGTNR